MEKLLRQIEAAIAAKDADSVLSLITFENAQALAEWNFVERKKNLKYDVLRQIPDYADKTNSELDKMLG